MILLPFQYRNQAFFSCINFCQVLREMLKTENVVQWFSTYIWRDLANVNVLENV